CTTKLLTASPAFFGDFAFASIAVSAAEKRDYEEVFIVCQVSVACFTSLSCLRPLQVSPGSRPAFSLAAIEISGLTLSFR
ncbi:hypothetical protein ACOTF1_26020, partial [Achromobacter ruhlandii]|uniref:hypothetical protein n=1 Tax=Achromobacter ruhlandii TaxID=72557 RepID=UPI003B9D9A30